MEKALDQAVRSKARGLCEYCHSSQEHYPERFQIDHVISRQHKGESTLQNLALCCLECNKRKGPNIAGIDPETGQMAPLFNPRRDEWKAHFKWLGAKLVGMSAIGRATITVLDINRAPRVVVRQTLIEEGVFPPS
jgi:hypothetical protein